jgi:hypothetical protein
MYFLSAVSLVLALRTLSSRAMPSPQDTSPGDGYVPLNTYEAFESPPPEETLLTLASDLNIQPVDLHYLSVFYTYNTLSVSEKADLTTKSICACGLSRVTAGLCGSMGVGERHSMGGDSKG